MQKHIISQSLAFDVILFTHPRHSKRGLQLPSANVDQTVSPFYSARRARAQLVWIKNRTVKRIRHTSRLLDVGWKLCFNTHTPCERSKGEIYICSRVKMVFALAELNLQFIGKRWMRELAKSVHLCGKINMAHEWHFSFATLSAWPDASLWISTAASHTSPKASSLAN